MAIKISGVNIVDDSQNLRITGLSTFTNGPVLIGAATSTGTATQRLQVTGGGYFSGDVGLGTTNPTSKLHISGGDVTLGVGVTITGATNGSLIINSTRSITNGTSIVSNIVPTTVSYGSSFVVASQDATPRDVVFSNDGKTMYVLGDAGNDITYYTLSTPWSITSASFVSQFSVASQLTTPTGLYWKPDGTKFYVVGNVGAAATAVNQYTCSNPWDLTTASYDSVAFSVTAQETAPRGIEFKPDGTKFYVVGIANDIIHQYSCSTPWNVSTASYDSVSFSVIAQESNPEKVRFSSDGTKFLVIGSSGDDINYYTLTTPWNVSTASFVGIITSLASVIGETVPTGLYWKPDGTKLYACGTTNDAVYEFNMTSNADLEVIGETKLYGDVEVHQDLKVYGDAYYGNSIGIGLTAPNELLEVAGNIHVSGGDRSIFNRSNNALAFGTNNTERARIDSSGRLLVGTSASPSVAPGQSSRLVVAGNAADFGSERGQFSISRTNAALNSGDDIGDILFTNPSGSAFASINCDADATPDTNYFPGRLVFSTTDSGAPPLGAPPSPTERMRIRSDGNIGIGGAGSANNTLQNQGPITGDINAGANATIATVQSDVTKLAYGHRVQIATAAASFTLDELSYYEVNAPALGAGSIITTQYGFYVRANLTGATNNYGFYSNIPSNTGRWNFYAAGGAPNYFAGDVRTNTVFTARTAPANSNVTATATAASLLDGLRTGTPGANINLTLPTGTNMDAAFQDLQNNQSFEWSLINLAAATHVITVVANTAHTVVGSMGVAAASSGRFLTRKTAANTFISYRIA